MSTSGRGSRVNEVIREVIAEAVQRELSDPRLGFVTITAVQANRDISEATVYFSALNENERESTAAALRSAAGLLQARIGAALRTKNTPHLTFTYDDLPEQAADLTRLIDDVTTDEDPA
jgi:ribosome-binding factor A